TISHLKGETRSLRNYVYGLGRNTCPHLTMSRGSRDYVPVQLPELKIGRAVPGYFAPCYASFGSCSVCLTDYDIDIVWDNGKSGFIIRIL
ncbi:hypothetical protein BU23DRAFT_417492, partial [Bimuria novae-zelandiae CBS 107.79]